MRDQGAVRRKGETLGVTEHIPCLRRRAISQLFRAKLFQDRNSNSTHWGGCCDTFFLSDDIDKGERDVRLGCAEPCAPESRATPAPGCTSHCPGRPKGTLRAQPHRSACSIFRLMWKWIVCCWAAPRGIRGETETPAARTGNGLRDEEKMNDRRCRKLKDGGGLEYLINWCCRWQHGA